MLHIPNQLPVPAHPEFWQVLDSTKLQCYCHCPRQFFFEYVLGWRAERSSNHLIFGQAWHEALEHLYKEGFSQEQLSPAFNKFLTCYRRDFPESTDTWFKGKSPENAAAALLEYIAEYPQDAYEIEVLDTEVGGQVGIGHDRFITVKLDLVGRRKGRIIALEHKTGSACGESWANQWKLSLQIGAYLHALNACYGREEDNPTVYVNGTFFYVKSRKFMRVPVMRSGVSMLNWLSSVHVLMDRIEEDFNKLQGDSPEDMTMDAFTMQPTACSNYAGCQFHDLCTCVGNPLKLKEPPTGFIEYWWDPLSDIKKEISNG